MKIKFENGIYEVNIFDIIIIKTDSMISEVTITAISSNEVAIKVNNQPDWKISNDYFVGSYFVDTAPSQPYAFSNLFERISKNKQEHVMPNQRYGVGSFSFNASSIDDSIWNNPYDSPYNKTHSQEY